MLHGQNGLVHTARLVASATEADNVRRALRACLLGVPLGEADYASLARGVELLDKAIRAAGAIDAEQRAMASLSGDARSLRALRGANELDELAESHIRVLRDTLSLVKRTGTAPHPEVEKALDVFSRLSRRSIEAFRSFVRPEFELAREAAD